MVKHICCQIVSLALGVLAFAAEPPAVPEFGDARVTLPYGELKTLWQAAQREKARRIGLFMAMFMRIGLLSVLIAAMVIGPRRQ